MAELYYLPNPSELPFVVYQQRKPAPLMFIVPGLGGHPNQGSANYIAELIYEQGFHVVILPSSMNWTFVSSLSIHGLSGLPLEDAKDMYGGMKKVYDYFKKKLGGQVTSVHGLGYSLGALTISHGANINEDDLIQFPSPHQLSKVI